MKVIMVSFRPVLYFLDGLFLASHAGVFRGARSSSLGRDEKQASLTTPAWEASPFQAPRW